ncbi:MAG: AbrB/MazE/SpoVT family DNA-binding domain-containing protein [Candidatus Bathyarchaeota archaeon]|jgi:AbrB family looped-hinge helix DNA binding protein|nr:AbrB/MazE/SpoVT family DNA-binding domain-containing protein [Candidatus Bathyarchaeota archaeon]MDI9577263.1 AbrB/MazE/SpoVT family DNA-binding domain-containing protein [Thermoproteota archaeon]NLD65864.1 AbrB/MazE/SpoVT family DNA-binding domain-containing protein [Thermoproteota archaeon]
MGQEETEIAVVGTKGQIVIPQRLRNELKITSKTKLALYRKDDMIVVTKLEVPSLRDELEKLASEVSKQQKQGISEKEILKEIQSYRLEKRGRKGE